MLTRIIAAIVIVSIGIHHSCPLSSDLDEEASLKAFKPGHLLAQITTPLFHYMTITTPYTAITDAASGPSDAHSDIDP